MLKGKKIIIGITGSIAAYKIPLLIRLLRKRGAEVQVILTPDAHHFVTPLTLSVLSENPVLTKPFNEEDGTWHSHVDMGVHADLMLIAPASANTMAKMATGIADNLLLTTWLAARCPVFFAPAMDLDMYQHSTTQHNIRNLVALGAHLIEPVEGELASGLCGAGRMEEPENILARIEEWFKKKSDFAGKRVLISAGPTREAIDPVRYLSNHSSGKMGYALAATFAERGAEVHLVSGPVDIRINHPGIKVLPVTSADEMFDACIALAPESDIIVMAAAVADFKPEYSAPQKLKKGEKESMVLNLLKNRDILATLGKSKKKNQLVVGFALESENEIENAGNKLENKNADLIVLNSINDPGAGFGTDTNIVTLIGRSGIHVELPLMSKARVAEQILDHIQTLIPVHPDQSHQ
ncbi:MAG: bifunctional phosphopantothenoylcysteine decarboxylase/phosphopantothenate--cysteine ligase CoaBC [Bacteroidales bacterium]